MKGISRFMFVAGVLAGLTYTQAGAQGRVGETVCSIPPDERIAFSYQAESFGGGTWYACGPVQCTITSSRTETEALDYVWNPTKGKDGRTSRISFACNSTAIRGSKRVGVKLYRLNAQQWGYDDDARRFLVR